MERDGGRAMSGPLKNPRHERFAQALATGMTQDAAYREANYKPDRRHASRLATNGDIQARVAELQERAAEKAVVTKAWVLEKLKENVERAMNSGETYNPMAANKALELLGKEMGMFIGRKVLGVKRLKDMTDDELLALLDDEDLEELGLSEMARDRR